MNIEMSEEAVSFFVPSVVNFFFFLVMFPLSRTAETALVIVVYSSVCPGDLIYREASLRNNNSIIFFFFLTFSASDRHKWETIKHICDSSRGLINRHKNIQTALKKQLLAQQPRKITPCRAHTYTQQTNMQAIIPVSNGTRTAICHSSCTFFCLFLFFFFGRGSIAVGCSVLVVPSAESPFFLLLTKIIRAELTIVLFFLLTWQCLVASHWPGTVWKHEECVCVRTCVSTRGKVWACHVGSLVFRVIEAEFLFVSSPPPLPESQVSLRLSLLSHSL